MSFEIDRLRQRSLRLGAYTTIETAVEDIDVFGSIETLVDVNTVNELLTNNREPEIYTPGDHLAMIKRLQDLNNNLERTYYEMGLICRELVVQGVPEKMGYVRVEKFYEEVVGIKYRRAKYFIDICNWAQNNSISEEQLVKIGWGKAKELVSLDKTRTAEIMLTIHSMTTEQVKEAVRGKSTGNRAVIRFSLFPDQMEAIDAAMSLAKDIFKTDDQNIAFTRLVLQWGMSQDEQLPINAVKEWLRAEYGLDTIPMENKNGV